MLKRAGLILPAQNNENPVTAIAWSTDGSILATVLCNGTIHIFQRGVLKCQIRVECSITNVAETDHSIKGIAFSIDSTQLAIAHARGAVCVHKIQNDWTLEAMPCNEFLQNSPVSCLVWSNKGPIVFGLENGKLRASQIQTEMVWTLYSSDTPTTAVAVNDAGSGILSSHIDGSIFHCELTTDGSMNPANRIITHVTIPKAIAWAQDSILAADENCHITFYDNRGELLKTLDYSEEAAVKNSSYFSCSSTDKTIAVNLCGKIHVYTWNDESHFWDEIDSSAVNIVGTVTALTLEKDGSELAVSGLLGTVAEFQILNTQTTFDIEKCKKSIGMLVRNVNSNLVSEISLENNNGMPGSTIWSTIQNCDEISESEATKYLEKSLDGKLKLEKSMNIAKHDKLVKNALVECDTQDNLSSIKPLFVTESTNESKIVSSFPTCSEEDILLKKNTQDEKKIEPVIDYISSDIASNTDKSSFTMDFGSIILTSDEEIDLTMDDSAIASRSVWQSHQQNGKIHRIDSFPSRVPTALIDDDIMFQNLNDIPYDPTIDPPCWKTNKLLGKNRSDTNRNFCCNCGRLDVRMKNCPRCKDAYRILKRQNSSQTNISTPIRFTRQYTPEELRSDFTLQLALLASLSPGLQRILEQQLFNPKKNQCR